MLISPSTTLRMQYSCGHSPHGNPENKHWYQRKKSRKIHPSADDETPSLASGVNWLLSAIKLQCFLGGLKARTERDMKIQAVEVFLNWKK